MPKKLGRGFEKISKLKNPKELFYFLEHNVATIYQVSFLHVFILDDSKTEYVLKKNITQVKDPALSERHIKLEWEDPIIKHLLEVKKGLSLKEVDKGLAISLTNSRHISLSLLKDRMINLKAEVCMPGFVRGRLITIFLLGRKISTEEFSDAELKNFSALAQQSALLIDRFNVVKREAKLFIESIRKINKDLEDKDVYTKGHSERVAEFSVIIADKLQDELQDIPYSEICLYYAAELHDIGKTILPDSLLKKQIKLNLEEWVQIKQHPLESARLIKPLEKWLGKIILEAVLDHHENYDGTGYPHGKKEGQISILARIIRVADSFDAMITDRPYRKAMNHHEVIAELKKGRGKQYDPRVIDSFLEAYKQGLFKDIFFSQLESEQ